jgi:hypothetical protein
MINAVSGPSEWISTSEVAAAMAKSKVVGFCEPGKSV